MFGMCLFFDYILVIPSTVFNCFVSKDPPKVRGIKVRNLPLADCCSDTFTIVGLFHHQHTCKAFPSRRNCEHHAKGQKTFFHCLSFLSSFSDDGRITFLYENLDLVFSDHFSGGDGILSLSET